jgi:hypothetical protein
MPRYLNDLEVFYDPSLQHSFNPGFDEGAPGAISRSKTTLIISSSIGVSGSIIPTFGLSTGSQNTTTIDAYTQGVELSQLKRHDAGFVKIWSGEAGHQLLVAWYGENGPSITNPFTDDPTAYFTDPSSIIKNSPKFPVLLFPIQTTEDLTSQGNPTLRYKTIRTPRAAGGSVFYRIDQDIAAVTMNGVIEPLAIRLQPSFYSNDVPTNPHVIGGSVGPGNEDAAKSSDLVLTVDYYDVTKHQPPFVDAAQNVNQFRFKTVIVGGISTIQTSSITSLSNPTTGSVVIGAQLGTFIDARYVRNVLPDPLEDTNMTNALSPMTGSTANYVRFDQRSATCGWSYDNNTAIGTDSLVFGGMTY